MLRYGIADVREVADGIRIFTMEPLGERLVHRPGQFVMMHLLDDKGASLDKRPYSIASAPDSQDLEFCIKMVGGRFTSKLALLKKGDVVGIDGPMGPASCGGDRCAFVCGGTGIAPVMSVVRDIARNGRQGRFFVFCSARDRKSLLYHEELLRLEKRNPSLKVVFTLTREEPAGWAGRCGRIGEAFLREFVADPKEYDWFICGPMAMAAAMRECVIGMGADPKRVHLEGWG
jgi:Na+-transporting NADH:ubiquinone oxidoreductase subunit F